jgi:hypothetical protein
MAVGSLFDAIVKAEIAQAMGWYNKDTTLSRMALIKKSVNESMLYLLPDAEKIFEFYKSCGAFEDLIAEQIFDIETEELKLIKHGLTGVEVPVFGKPDLKSVPNRILDFKVNGFGSKSGQSPKQGYCRSYDRTGRLGPHKKLLTMDLIDDDWARQLTTYAWLDQEEFEFKDIEVGIEQIAIRGDTIKVASFRTIVPKLYQEQLYIHYSLMWSQILNGIVDDPQPKKDRCFMYGQQCEVSHKCNAFKQAFGDTGFNDLVNSL